MANVSRPSGFKPVRHLNGSPFNGQCSMYSIDATDATVIAMGDMVKLDGSTDATLNIRQVTRATVSAAVLGAVVGFKVDPTDLNNPQQYRKALTQRYVFVADSPDVIYECQANALLTAANLGNLCDITIAAASTVTGQSAMQADASTTGTTSTIVLRILDFVQRSDNTAAATGNKILVMINYHQMATAMAGV